MSYCLLNGSCSKEKFKIIHTATFYQQSLVLFGKKFIVTPWNINCCRQSDFKVFLFSKYSKYLSKFFLGDYNKGYFERDDQVCNDWF